MLSRPTVFDIPRQLPVIFSIAPLIHCWVVPLCTFNTSASSRPVPCVSSRIWISPHQFERSYIVKVPACVRVVCFGVYYGMKLLPWCLWYMHLSCALLLSDIMVLSYAGVYQIGQQMFASKRINTHWSQSIKLYKLFVSEMSYQYLLMCCAIYPIAWLSSVFQVEPPRQHFGFMMSQQEIPYHHNRLQKLTWPDCI